jgi:hypothetical protein
VPFPTPPGAPRPRPKSDLHPGLGAGFDPYDPEHVLLREWLLEEIGFDGIDELFDDWPVRWIRRATEEVMGAIRHGKAVQKPSGLVMYHLKNYLARWRATRRG